MLCKQVAEFEVKSLPVLACAAMVSLVIEDGQYNLGSLIVEVFGDEELCVCLLEIWV